MSTNWLPATSATAATDLRVGFPSPSGPLNAGGGLQKFVIELRKTAGAPNPTIIAQLHEDGSADGSPLATLLNGTAITSATQQILELTWDAALLADISGADVELRIVSTPGSAPPAMAVTRYAGDDNSSLAWSTVGAASGDLVLVLFANDGGDNQSGLANFTRVGTNVGASVEFGFYYRICTGAETGNVLTSEGSFGVSVEEYSWHVFKIAAGTWHGTTPPEMSTPSVATGGTPDAPSLTPSWGAESETTFFVSVCRDDDDGIPGAPTGYETNFARNAGGINGPEIATSWRTPSPAVTAEDPGTWSVTGTAEEYIAVTIAVRPAAAVGVNTVEIGAINWVADYTAGEPLSSSDTIAVSTSETGAGTAVLISSDQVAAVVSDAAAIAAAVASSDAVAAALSEAALVLADKAGSDGIVIAASESPTVTAALTVGDAITVSTTEEIALALTSSDALAVGSTEVGVLPEIPKDSNDAIDVATTDAGALTAAFAGADTTAISTAETADVDASVAASDSLTEALDDAGTVATVLGSADAIAIATTEQGTLAGLPLESADSVAIGTAETGAVTIVISYGSDAVAVAVSDAADLAATALVADQVSVAVTDAAALATVLDSADDIAVSVSDADTLGASLNASDTAASSLAEATELTAEQASADALAVGTSEVGDLTGTTKQGSDALGVATPASSELVAAVIPSPDEVGVALVEEAAFEAALTSTDVLSVITSENGVLGGPPVIGVGTVGQLPFNSTSGSSYTWNTGLTLDGGGAALLGIVVWVTSSGDRAANHAGPPDLFTLNGSAPDHLLLEYLDNLSTDTRYVQAVAGIWNNPTDGALAINFFNSIDATGAGAYFANLTNLAESPLGVLIRNQGGTGTALTFQLTTTKTDSLVIAIHGTRNPGKTPFTFDDQAFVSIGEYDAGGALDGSWDVGYRHTKSTMAYDGGGDWAVSDIERIGGGAFELLAFTTTVASSDAIGVGISESVPITAAAIPGSDAVTVSLSGANELGAIEAASNDAVSIVLSETAELDAALASADAVSLATVENDGIQQTSAGDTAGISTADFASVAAVLGSSDAIVVAAFDDAQRTGLQEVQSADTLALLFSELDIPTAALTIQDSILFEFIDFASLGGSILPLEGGIVTTVQATGRIQTAVQLEGTFG